MFFISRFKDVERREYECEVVTPLFLGGADPKKAELRAPPVKAAMRYWWRALYDGSDVKTMANDEAAIFGSTDRKAVVSVNLDIQNVKATPESLPSGKMVPVEGKSYKTSIINYLSYGLFEYKSDVKKNVYTKEHIEPNARFKIIVSFPRTVEADIIKALKAMISFGGLGARTRNGFGSLHCDELMDHNFKKDGPLKSFTAFSEGARLFNQFHVHKTWHDALSEIGEVYRQARLNLEGKQHEWTKRALIAMPIEAKNEKIPTHISSGRHAKPYFLHVNKTDGKYRGQILFLPYLYKAGPKDTTNRLREYEEACKKMNEEITKGMGGAK
ncbi:MAG: type III-B CRISPR module RAMP protein Cmr1 [Syntrophales bacterium]|nr:type III-B CRISPR module RAMP protein Cmr1 [Syntrophales bacterium]